MQESTEICKAQKMTEPEFPPTDDSFEEQTTHHLTVADDERKLRLDKLLAQRLPELSRSRIQSLMAEGMVLLDNAVVDNANYRVKSGQSITLTLPPAEDADPVPQDIPLDIVFEDEHLLVVNKPSGMVVHPAPGNSDGTLVNALLYHCGDDLQGIGGVKRPGIVHRIDKDTSGLMVVAKTEPCHHGLVELFSRHDIERSYQALVWGVPSPVRGTITGNIGRSPQNRKKMAVVPKGGKAATTHYRLLDTLAHDTVALVECRLETGRTHQIRVHMTHMGTPLVGDPVYGNQSKSRQKHFSAEAKNLMEDFNRQALHAKTLGFIHPITGEDHLFESELSNDLKALINTL